MLKPHLGSHCFGRIRGIILLAGVLGALAFPSLAATADEEEGRSAGPPDFVPPPPPTGSPPSLPPGLREESGEARPARRPPVRRDRPAAEPQAGVEPDSAMQRLLGADRRAQLYSDSVRAFVDPDMNQEVGLIRLPELGTNEVIEMLENLTRKPILRQQNLPSVRITFFSQDAMTRGEAILAIESLLSLNGIAITVVGERFLKAVPKGAIDTQVPQILHTSTLNLAPSQQVYSKFFDLDVLSNEEAVSLLQPLMTQGAPVSFPKSGQLKVTDALINLQYVETMLEKMDRPARMRHELKFYELENINVADLHQRLQALKDGSLKPQLEGNAFFDSEERTNQLIVLAHPSSVPLIEDLIAKFDVDVAPLTETRIFDIKHAEAREVSALIQEVVTGQERAREEDGGSPRRTAQRPRPEADDSEDRADPRSRGVTQADSGMPVGDAEGRALQFSKHLTLVPDERANTIIAHGTSSDLRHIENLIDKIDIILAQVRIEVLITEITLREREARGIDVVRYALGRQIGGGGGDGDQGAGSSDRLHRVLPQFRDDHLEFGDALTFGGGLADFTMEVILREARTNDNLRVLSAPTVVTTHAREAEISVGERRPFPTSTITDGVSTGVASRTQIQREDIGINLKVRPLIGANGVIQLEIDQQVDDVTAERVAIADTSVPVVTQRHANSYVSVANGELIVLGGLQSVTRERQEGKVFLLGDIPVLGRFFRPQTDEHRRTELLIFIRPVILETTDRAHLDALQQLNNIQGGDLIEQFLETNRVEIPPFDEEEDLEERPRPPRRGGRL